MKSVPHRTNTLVKHVNETNVIDQSIKDILHKIHQEGYLAQEAEAIGIAGGEATLKEIMRTEGTLHTIDRGMLAIHFHLNLDWVYTDL